MTPFKQSHKCVFDVIIRQKCSTFVVGLRRVTAKHLSPIYNKRSGKLWVKCTGQNFSEKVLTPGDKLPKMIILGCWLS